MTRGREANQLYLVARRDRDRDEFGPSTRARPDAIEALVAQLERHQAQELALDQLPLQAGRSWPVRGRSGMGQQLSFDVPDGLQEAIARRAAAIVAAS